MSEKIIKAFKNAAIEKKNRQDYFNIAVSVDCVIFGYDNHELYVLLMQSDLEEFQGLNSLLGDLVRPNEDLTEASFRILWERTGLQNVYLEQVHTFGKVCRHPSGRVITTAYFSLIDMQHQQLNIAEHQLNWYPVRTVKRLAFDHLEILQLCLHQLQQRVMERPIIFHLLPPLFSLRELQSVFEAILGVELDRRNFRKKIAVKDWIIDTNTLEKEVNHRPGKLYKLKAGLTNNFRPYQ
jgi:8-oxo-dGTP diphosphatase